MTLDSPLLRLSIFAALFGLCFVCERIWPRRHLIASRLKRWPVNVGLGIINIIALRIIAPAGLIAIGMNIDGGLLSTISLSGGVAIMVSLIIFDFAIYAQHRLFHTVNAFWVFHRIHHTDRDLDVSSALRFHIGEYVISFAYKAALIWMIHPPVEAIILFEIILSACALFNHSNWSLGIFDPILRMAIVTPDMHRLHHSIDEEEAHRNFGFCLSIWDRLFTSYRAEPRQNMVRLSLGVGDDPQEGDTLLFRLIEPLISLYRFFPSATK